MDLKEAIVEKVGKEWGAVHSEERSGLGGSMDTQPPTAQAGTRGRGCRSVDASVAARSSLLLVFMLSVTWEVSPQQSKDGRSGSKTLQKEKAGTNPRVHWLGGEVGLRGSGSARVRGEHSQRDHQDTPDLTKGESCTGPEAGCLLPAGGLLGSVPWATGS